MVPDTVRMKNIDVLVIGGGIAAVTAAIKAREAGAGSVVIVDKSMPGKNGNSAFAAGVMHVHFPDEDDVENRVMRLTRSAGFLTKQDILFDQLSDSFPYLEDMQRYGVQFHRDEDGRIKRVAGRGAWPVITFLSTQLMHAMRETAENLGVQIMPRIHVTDLLTRDGRCIGAVGFNARTGEWFEFSARATILATGNTWYKGICPGNRDLSGDGYTMALRAGVELTGSECTDQIANCMPVRIDAGPGMNKFVGEGCYFVNRFDERFVVKYNPKLKERCGLPHLVPWMCIEVKAGRGPIYMDLRHADEAAVQRLHDILTLPMRMFESVGVVQNGRFREKVEWSPTAPGGRPGLFVERDYSTSLPGLYGAGEVCMTQAVPTGLVQSGTSGIRSARAAWKFAQSTEWLEPDRDQIGAHRERAYAPLNRTSGVHPDNLILAVQDIVCPYDVLLLRHGARLAKARKAIEQVLAEVVPEVRATDPHELRMANEGISMAEVALMHIISSDLRTESRVGMREDFPYQDDDNWLKWIMIQKKEDGHVDYWLRDVPFDKYPNQPDRGKKLAYVWQRAVDFNVVSVSEGGEIQWESNESTPSGAPAAASV